MYKRQEERCTNVETTVNTIQTWVDSNHERIEDIQRQEIPRIREEIENIGNRPAVVPTFQHADNREAMNFWAYKRNPMEFLARIDETLSRNRETRWPIIRGKIDKYFKEINDNWWTATRHDIQSYAEFKELFKAKYWSESTQNIVRDNICYGRYETGRLSLIHI